MKYERGKTIIDRLTGDKITIISSNFCRYRCSVESKDGLFRFQTFTRDQLDRITHISEEVDE